MRIVPEQAAHAAEIETLLDIAFGTDRQRKTSYRLRDGVPPEAGLCWVVERVDHHRVEATIRYWPVRIGGQVPALLLGPIAVAPQRRSEGIGGVLIRQTLQAAQALGHRIVLLVGDEPYYGRFGFSRALTEGLALPGPVDRDRFLGLELVPGALDGVRGVVQCLSSGGFAPRPPPPKAPFIKEGGPLETIY